MNLWTVLVEHRQEILTLTGEHLWLVGASMAIALAIGIPAGILLARRPRLRPTILGTANVIETIPSLALFGFLLSVPWIEQRADRPHVEPGSVEVAAAEDVALLQHLRERRGQIGLALRVDERVGPQPFDRCRREHPHAAQREVRARMLGLLLEVDDAVAFAEAGQWEPVADLTRDVYAETKP